MFLSLLEPWFILGIAPLSPRCQESGKGEKALFTLYGTVQIREISTEVAY